METKDEQIPWHRLLGLCWEDFFRGSDVVVDPEKDLSLRQQFVDLVILRPAGAQPPRRMPDGFEELGRHNLITFKSNRDTMKSWVLRELVAHYVNYRKQASPSMREEDLLPEEDFRLFVICVRTPQAMARKVPLTKISDGVYEVAHFDGVIRVIVIHELPILSHNAMLHLFSAREDLLEYGAKNYRHYSGETSTFLYQLYARYRKEEPDVGQRLDEFIRQTRKQMRREALEEMTPEECQEIVQKLTPEQRQEIVQKLTPEQRQEIVQKLTPEQRQEIVQKLTPQERLAGLSNEEIAEVLRRRQNGSSSTSPNG